MGNYEVNWDSDAYRLDYNPGPLFMTGVSPWFFTVRPFRYRSRKGHTDIIE
jgi:hypothetical protein